MILYSEIQLQRAYRVYCSKIPMGQVVPDLEFFRTMIEEMYNADFFEELLAEYEESGFPKGIH